jgi:putative hemolysin
MSIPPTREYQTVAGFALDRLGRIPEPGDSFTEGNFHFEVVDLDGRRIDKLIVTRTIPTKRRVAQ